MMKTMVESGFMIPTMQFGPDDVFLFEDWEKTPVGPYRALFHFTPEDFRTLYADRPEALELVSTIHRFDRTFLSSIRTKKEPGKITIDVISSDESFHIEIAYGEPLLLKLLNPLAAHLPDFICMKEYYLKFAPRLLAPLLKTDPDQKMSGITEMGKKSTFRIYRIWRIAGGNCRKNGEEIGSIVECGYDHDMGDFRPVSKPILSKVDLLVSE